MTKNWEVDIVACLVTQQLRGKRYLHVFAHLQRQREQKHALQKLTAKDAHPKELSAAVP
jgi:hypothetical protein